MYNLDELKIHTSIKGFGLFPWSLLKSDFWRTDHAVKVTLLPHSFLDTSTLNPFMKLSPQNSELYNTHY
jgi:hypothetical protein